MQHHDPQRIFYEIHDQEQWLPLIRDPFDPIPHPRIADDEKSKNPGKTDEQEKKPKKEKKGEAEKKKINELKKRGDFMKPFLSFYDPKAMEPGLGEKQL